MGTPGRYSPLLLLIMLCSLSARMFTPKGRAALKMSIPTSTIASNGYTSVMIVPTGIGASIGGFAGDALPSARLLSSCVDTLITHPNVLNGAMMYWPLENTLYVRVCP